MGDDPKEAPIVHGPLGDAPATYTFVSNTYDYKGNLVSSNTNMLTNEIEGLAHGEYVTDTYLPDPNRPVIRDGNLVVANMPSTNNSFTPYGHPAPQEQTLSEVGQQIWDAYKMQDPITAGAINGTWNFASSTVSGIWNLVTHPEEAIIGIAKFAYYTDLNSPGRFTLEGIQYNANLAATLEGTWNKFKNGDAYTKTSMGTEAALTIGSFFFGGGEGRIAGEIGWSSKSLKVAEAELNAGKTEIWLKSQSEAEELFLRRFQGEGYKNTTGMTTKDMKDKFLFPKGKSGTYHWDLYDTQHGGVPHLQVHPFEGKGIIRIFFEL